MCGLSLALIDIYIHAYTNRWNNNKVERWAAVSPSPSLEHPTDGQASSVPLRLIGPLITHPNHIKPAIHTPCFQYSAEVIRSGAIKLHHLLVICLWIELGSRPLCPVIVSVSIVSLGRGCLDLLRAWKEGRDTLPACCPPACLWNPEVLVWF